MIFLEKIKEVLQNMEREKDLTKTRALTDLEPLQEELKEEKKEVEVEVKK